MNNSKKRPIKFLDLTLETKDKKSLLEAVNRVLSSGIFILGKEVAEFEKKFAKYLGVKHCIGVGNGLEALQISLMSLGLEKDDEVITTPISAVATTLAILAVGARAVFVDVLENGLINPDLIALSITKKTKAIIPVHLYGNSVQLDKIKKLCQKYKLKLIEDTAQAHGATYKNKLLGTFGDLGCFSFYPTKNLGAFGDGGAIATNNSNLAGICYEIRDYGQNKKYHHIRYGLNSRLDELQAAFLNLKLKHLDKDNLSRSRLAQRYIDNLSKIKGIEIILPEYKTKSNFHLFVIRTSQRDKLANYLKKNNIQTLIHYPIIIPDQPFLKKRYEQLSLPIAREFVKNCLSLPLYPKMKISDIDYISSKITQFFISLDAN